MNKSKPELTKLTSDKIEALCTEFRQSYGQVADKTLFVDTGVRRSL